MAHHAYTFRYRVRNWHHYNQALIARDGITFWIDEATLMTWRNTHGVLAPNAALRSQIVPGDRDQAPATADGDGDSPAATTPARLGIGNLKGLFAWTGTYQSTR